MKSVILIILAISLITYIFYKYTIKTQNTKENFEYQIETSKNKINILTLSGGGGIAHSVFFACISNLMIMFRNIKNDQNLKLHDLLCKVHTIGANSGGSWLATMLFYDIEFNYDFNTKIRDFDTIANVYNDIYLFFLRVRWIFDLAEEFITSPWIPEPARIILKKLAAISAVTGQWYNFVKDIVLLGREYLNYTKMTDTLPEFKNKEIIFQSGVYTTGRLGGEDLYQSFISEIGRTVSNIFTDIRRPYISYSFKNPSSFCRGVPLCALTNRNLWKEDGNNFGADCCRNNNNSQTCGMQIPFTFSKKGVKCIQDNFPEKIDIQYIAYDDDIEKNPLFPDNLEEQINSKLRREDFLKYDTSKELVVAATACSSAANSIFTQSCEFKRILLNARFMTNDIINILIEQGKNVSPILVLNSQDTKKIKPDNNMFLDNMDMGRSVTRREDWRNVLEIENKYKVLRMNDGALTEDGGIVAAIKSAQTRCCRKTLNIFSFIQTDKLIEGLPDKINFLFKKSGENNQMFGMFNNQTFPELFRTRAVDSSIPPQRYNMTNALPFERVGIFKEENINPTIIYPQNGSIEDNDKYFKLNYLYYKEIETIDRPEYSIKRGTKVNLHIISFLRNDDKMFIAPLLVNKIDNFRVLCEKSSNLFRTLVNELKSNGIVDIPSLFV
jgi:hypothetical protein